ncbi:hypothetical protein ACFXBB_07225 [Streptomyces scopuliridis]|uniref:hypothetical protein n=1 Tax=Streptomyces scopuliridis TaxID=452529 RepID=UPI0036A148A6
MNASALPIHPRTGESALGLRRDGRPIWPIKGGSGEGGDPASADGPNPAPSADPGTPSAPPANDPAAERQLADATKRAEQATTERDAALAEARRLRVELAAHQAAHKGGADPARLLDSHSVATQLEALDPSDAKFAERLDCVIAAAVEANPLLRADGGAPAGPPKGGADFTPGAPATVTPEQFARLSYAERVDLHQSDPNLYRQLSAASE